MHAGCADADACDVPVRTYVRMKPRTAELHSSLAVDPHISAIDGPKVTVAARKGERIFDHSYATFEEKSTQEEAFESAMRPLLDLFLAGHDVDMLLYGQTGACIII
jgi:hypothetical protein